MELVWCNKVNAVEQINKSVNLKRENGVTHEQISSSRYHNIVHYYHINNENSFKFVFFHFFQGAECGRYGRGLPLQAAPRPVARGGAGHGAPRPPAAAGGLPVPPGHCGQVRRDGRAHVLPRLQRALSGRSLA